YSSEDDQDEFGQEFGDRFATLLLILQTAKEGGGTVYPHLYRTIIPEAGDILFWTNLDRLGNGNEKSLHGACPIIEGKKIAATLWIREHGQSLMSNPMESGLFDIEKLIKPRIM
ncbi:unnamed protein product, partial [Strongylus vulgaris]